MGSAFSVDHGRIVETGFQVNEVSYTEQGFSRFCSSQLVGKGTFNFVDTIYVTQEEISDPLNHPYGGTVWSWMWNARPSTRYQRWGAWREKI